MKKSFLLLAAGLIAGIANGQTLKTGSDHIATQKNNVAASPAGINYATTPAPLVTPAPLTGAKTTTGGGRWYNYGNILANESGSTCNPVAGLSNTGLDLWNDTTAVYGYTGGTTVYAQNDFVSVGLFFDGFDPAYTGWNNTTNFPSEIYLSPANAYTIDSVFVGGWYNRSFANAAKDSVTDTLILAFVQGTASTNFADEYFTSTSLLSDYCSPISGHLDFLEMFHDSLNNRAANLVGTTITPVPTTQVYKILLNRLDTNNADDTRGTQYPRYVIPTPGKSLDPMISFPVTAGNYASMSVTFKSGDHTYPATPLTGAGGIAFPGSYDTVRYSSGIGGTISYKYNTYTANILFAATASGSTIASFPPYNWPNDKTSGFYKRENAGSWGGQYIPNWGWTSGGGASALQFPDIAYHIQCPTCLTTEGVAKVTSVKSVTATPNPANNELNISFSNSRNEAVTVSITNMVGQVVATQKTTTGTVVFNTSALAAGVYVYAVEANGIRSTGRVAIAH